MKAFALVLISLSLGMLSGCVGYVAGPTNGLPAGAQSVRVEFFKNETLEPRLVVAVNRALKRNLQQDGTYKLETQGNADLVVTGELTEFLRSGVSYTPGDSLSVKDYSMSLTAHIKVTRPARAKWCTKANHRQQHGARGERPHRRPRQAVPIIADHLARQATSLIVDGKWPEAAAAAIK